MAVGASCGTGSHDFAVADIFVPAALTSPPPPRPLSYGDRWGGPLYQAPFLWPMRGALALGIARQALDTLITLGQTRKPLGASTLLRDLQEALGRAVAAYAAERGYLSAVNALWETLAAEQRPTDEEYVRMPLASAHTVTTCAAVLPRYQHADGRPDRSTVGGEAAGSVAFGPALARAMF